MATSQSIKTTLYKDKTRIDTVYLDGIPNVGEYLQIDDQQYIVRKRNFTLTKRGPGFTGYSQSCELILRSTSEPINLDC